MDNVSFSFDFTSLGRIGSDNQVIPVESGVTYDCIIIGGGPAALTAAVYSMRKGMNTALITENFGGQVVETSAIENYMGYRYIEGAELAAKFSDQVKQFTISISEHTTVESVIPGKPHSVVFSNGKSASARTIIIATGKSWRKLDVPGEKNFTGKGVAYCTICDAPLFKGKTVAVVGGGNSGVESAIDLVKVAEKVIVIQNIDRLTADALLVEKLAQAKNIDYIYNSTVREIRGVDIVSSIVVQNNKTHQPDEISVHGVFISIGLISNSLLAREAVKVNKSGEIIIGSRCETNIPGIFAAGDVTDVPYKQIIIASGEGAKAALSAYEYCTNER